MAFSGWRTFAAGSAQKNAGDARFGHRLRVLAAEVSLSFSHRLGRGAHTTIGCYCHLAFLLAFFLPPFFPAFLAAFLALRFAMDITSFRQSI
jgi:accessory gene regulator protein AgrB